MGIKPTTTTVAAKTTTYNNMHFYSISLAIVLNKLASTQTHTHIPWQTSQWNKNKTQTRENLYNNKKSNAPTDVGRPLSCRTCVLYIYVCLAFSLVHMAYGRWALTLPTEATITTTAAETMMTTSTTKEKKKSRQICNC